MVCCDDTRRRLHHANRIPVMTRTPTRRRLLALALASALAAPAWAQSIDPFTVSDIRVDGLQRISAGTVFTYLPVERGDRIDQTKAGEHLAG